MNIRLLLSTSLLFPVCMHAMEEQDAAKDPHANSGVMHYASKMLWPKQYVCDPDNNKLYEEYKAKIDNTLIERLRTDVKFWEDHKRISERTIKLQMVVETAIKEKDFNTLTLLCLYNEELPNPLELARKALAEAQIKIGKVLKKEAAPEK